MTIYVILSGLPGSMTTEAMKVIRQQEDMQLVPYALTGSRDKELSYNGFTLIPPHGHAAILRDMKSHYPGLIVVDYSKAPMEQQADLYADQIGVPFVYGGTVGDRDLAEKIVRESDISAVIAPNMSKQLVAWTAALEYIAREFPDSFSGYHGSVHETHQKSKKDPSGTGKAWMGTMRKWGIEFDDMISIREPDDQRTLGVPEEYLDGHGYHWFDLKSPDGTVQLSFATKVDGRQTYADGTPDAIRYLHRKVSEGSRGEVFSMVDVLKGV